MSCRTTPAGSAFTSYARFANGSVLSDVATLSTFHRLRSLYQGRSPEDRRAYTDEDYRGLIQRQMERVRNLRNLSEARRESMLARLQQAYDDPNLPDQSTLYALFNLNPTIRSRGNAQDRFISNYAARFEITREEALNRWREIENSIDRSRSAPNPTTFTEENQTLARDMDLPRDPGSVHAMSVMNDELNVREMIVASNAVQRIERSVSDIPVDEKRTITEYGYDPRSGRLEVVVHDNENGEQVFAYRDISEEDYNSHINAGEADFVLWWRDTIHGSSEHAYSTSLEAAQAGRAPRCTVCGQFADMRHSCPVLPEPTRFTSYSGRWTRQDVELPRPADPSNPDAEPGSYHWNYRLPGAMRLREAFQEGPVRVPLSEWMRNWTPDGYEHARLNGSLMAYRTEEGEVAFNVAELNCSCDSYNETGQCRHIDGATMALRRRLIPPQRRPLSSLTPAERAERQAEAERRANERAEQARQAASNDWTRNEETLAEARRTWRSSSEILYSENTEAFEVAFRAASESASNESPNIPYQRENALDGMATRGSGQAFGVEIEYDFPPSMSYHERREANNAIGRELFAAGLASSPSQLGYGASRRLGFRDTHNDGSGNSNWSFERDGSVGGGELVTPAMYDEPETWERLETAIDILKRHGAVTSRKAGAHVHVGTGTYNGDSSKYTELARLMTQHEDVMLRLASDPHRGKHRNTHYTSPLREVPVEGFSDLTQAKRWQGGRTSALNMTSTARQGEDSSKDHVEFRVFDASLHAGALQGQIKTAVAMTNAAARIAGEGPTKRTKEPAGSHSERAKARGRRRLTSEDLAEDTATFRSLLDTLFTRKADKDQLISMFAHTKWSTVSSRRRY